MNKDTFIGFRGSDRPSDRPPLLDPPLVLRELYCFVVTKRVLSKTAKVSDFKSIFLRSSPVVMNLRWRLKEYLQKNRRQRWNICEESTVWHFVTRSTGLKSVKSGISSYFSESRDLSCVSTAMYIQNVPGENSKLRPLGYSLHQLCPARGPRAACGPFEGFVQPSLGLRQSKSILYTDNLSLIW